MLFRSIWTVYMRSYVVLFMIVMLVLGKIGISVLLFAGIDAAGAAWTLLSMKQ